MLDKKEENFNVYRVSLRYAFETKTLKNQFIKELDRKNLVYCKSYKWAGEISTKRRKKFNSLLIKNYTYTSGELFNIHEKNFEMTYKTFQRDLIYLEQNGYVKSKVIKGGSIGKTKLVEKI